MPDAATDCTKYFWNTKYKIKTGRMPMTITHIIRFHSGCLMTDAPQI